jgi:hypothetical protein
MKFLASALTALAFGNPMSEAKQLSTEDLNEMIKSGKISKEEILSKSIPLPKRKLENYNNGNNNNYYYYNDGNDNQNNGYGNYNQNNNGDNTNGYNQNYNNHNGNEYNYTAEETEYVDVGFNGNSTIRFNKCMSFAVQDGDLIGDEDILSYAQSGTIVAQQSYVLFDVEVCEPGNCVFDEADMSKIYMVPLETFMYSMIEYYPNMREQYCESCETHYNYCIKGNGRYYDTGTYMNGGEYCYEGEQYKLINCHQCTNYGCFGGSYATQKYENYDSVAEWIEEMAYCKETGTYWGNSALYTGLMCNEEGDGVDFGVFVDEDCKYYHKEKSVMKVLQQDDWEYFYKMPDAIEFMFTKSLSCKDVSEVNYMNAFQPVYENDNDDQCEIGEQINDSCASLFGDYGVPLDGCGSADDQDWNYEEEDDDNEYQYSGIDDIWKSSGLYNYDISYSAAQDQSSICQIVADKYLSRNHQNVYGPQSSSSMFSYSNSNDLDVKKNAWGKRERSSAGDKFAYALLAGAVAFIAIYAGRRYYKATQTKEIELNHNKDLPLIS